MSIVALLSLVAHARYGAELLQGRVLLRAQCSSPGLHPPAALSPAPLASLALVFWTLVGHWMLDGTSADAHASQHGAMSGMRLADAVEAPVASIVTRDAAMSI